MFAFCLQLVVAINNKNGGLNLFSLQITIAKKFAVNAF